MRILQVISTPPPIWETGGCTRIAYELSKALVRMGHEVDILTTDMYKRGQRYENILNPEFLEGIRVFRFRNICDRLAWDRYMYTDLGAWSFLKEHIMNYDIVHLQDFRSFQTISTVYYCNKYNIPYIIQPHGCHLNVASMDLKWLFDKLFMKYILKSSKCIIVLNEEEKKRIEGYGVEKEKIFTVPNGISFKDEIVYELGYFKRNYNINQQYKLLLYVGRIHESKGIDLLVRSFNDILNNTKDVRLVIIGPDDGYKYSLESLIQCLGIKDKVIFTGFINDDEKIAALKDSDIFITPTYSGFPVTFLEACACGIPIITTRRSDNLDWIHGNVGYVTDYSVEKLSEAILTILRNKSLKEELGRNGQRLVKEKFSWDIVAKQMESIYMAFA